MKPEEQRIAIAEACGWEKKYSSMYDKKCWYNELGTKVTPTQDQLPDYLHDLNAMHEAEKWLIEDDQHAYGCYCIDLQEEYGNTVSLTASQRAEAFLRTIGKWTTNPNKL